MLALSERFDSAGGSWKLALILFLAAPVSWLAMPAVAPWPGCILLAMAALLALGTTLVVADHSLAARRPDEVPSQENVQELAAILEEQHGRMQEAAATVSRAVTAGAQLITLVRGAEQQWRQLLDQAASPSVPPIAWQDHWAVFQNNQTHLQQRFDGLETRLDSLHHYLAEQMAPSSVLLADVLPANLLRLESVAQTLARQGASQARHEASLGDAARYLTEVSDRLRDGVQVVETQGVRLHALLMAQRVMEAASSTQNRDDTPDDGAGEAQGSTSLRYLRSSSLPPDRPTH
jgi:hypothetical protein